MLMVHAKITAGRYGVACIPRKGFVFSLAIIYLTIIYLNAVSVMLSPSAFGGSPPQPPNAEVQVIVKGVATPFSVFGLLRRLGQIPGVAHVSFDLSQGLADVLLQPGATVTDHQVREAVRDASYTPGPIRRKPTAPDEHAN